MLPAMSVGRYVARDTGATFGVSREFAGGVRAVRIATRLYPRTRAADLDAIARHWHRVMD